MAGQRPLYRDATTGMIKELTDSDSLIVGQGISPTFLDYDKLLATAMFVVDNSGFVPGSN